MRPANNTTTPSISQIVNRAADVVDPTGADADVAAFFERFEDSDEPATVLEDPAQTFEEARASIDVDGASAPLSVTAAVASYLAYKREQIDGDADQIVRLAVKAGFDDNPPEPVDTWLAQQGIAL